MVLAICDLVVSHGHVALLGDTSAQPSPPISSYCAQCLNPFKYNHTKFGTEYEVSASPNFQFSSCEKG